MPITIYCSMIISCVLVHCHPSSPATEAYSFSKSTMEFYVCAKICVHRLGTSCFKSHPRRLGYVELIPWSLTQEDFCRINVRSGNQTSAPVQALDHKSNSQPLYHRVWQEAFQIGNFSLFLSCVWQLDFSGFSSKLIIHDFALVLCCLVAFGESVFIGSR